MNWRKSSYSSYNGSCVEIGAWRVSSHSMGNGDCIEVGRGGAVIGVRDSKDPDGAVLAFGAAAWERFTARLR